MKKIVIIALCLCIFLFSIVLPVTVYADSYIESWASDKYKTYETAVYAPVGLVSTYGAISYFVTVTEVDYRVLLDGYKWYYTPLTVFAIDRYGADFGYCFWIDANGDYQHFMYSTVDDGNSEKVENVDITDATPAQLTGEEFAYIIARLNDQYGVKDAKKYISIQTDKRYDPTKIASGGNLSFFSEGRFCNQSDWDDCYIIPFYFDGKSYYFGLIQAYFTQVVTSSDSGNSITMNVEFTSMLDSEYSAVIPVMRNSYSVDFANYRYMDLNLNFSSNGMNSFCFSSYSDYISKSSSLYCKMLHNGDSSGMCSYNAFYSMDCLKSGTYDDVLYANALYPNCYADSDTYIEGADMGFFVSDEPIDMGLNWTGIDPEEIDPELTVTMDGDTIYDYSVTNVSGDTSTVNEYVTNNYNITVGGSGESSGGSTSGNVNVSGNIGVGGEVDININVNDNRGDGFTVDPYDYYDANVEEALEQLPEMGDGFIAFMNKVLNWLPVEIYALLIGGIGLAVLCRIVGR